MKSITRRQFAGGAAALATLGLAACGCSKGDQQEAATTGQTTDSTPVEASSVVLDSKAWLYNAEDDVYYQLGITYCSKPADSSYEQLALFVPGAYFEATDNGDGTFTCAPSDAKSVGAYTATTAPIVMPIDTPGYSAQRPLNAYTSVKEFTSEGLVYAHAGCRGRDHGAPAGVVDLKAAVRFMRASSASMAGSTDRIFTFGMSGGGAQSALMGATGDSPLYDPYLTAIGAATGVSDAIVGSMDWCPVTGLDVADAAYEWMMGPTRSDLPEDDQAVSDGLAAAFASYINSVGLVDKSGAQLALEESEEGIYQAGSYYARVVEAIETSLNDFLSDTTFPYDASSAMSGPGGMGGPGGRARPADAPDDAGAPTATGTETTSTEEKVDNTNGLGPAPDGGNGVARRGAGGPVDTSAAAVFLPRTGEGEEVVADGDAEQVETDGQSFEQRDNISRSQNEGGVSLSGTYETVQDYVAALNADGEWVTYDEATNTATISSVEAFCVALKRASKSLGAFDQFDRGQGENTLFGIDGNPAHFDAMLAKILQDNNNAAAPGYASDLQLTDAQGTSMQTRVNMYTPLYYLLSTQEGHGTSTPAKYWRIRSGINQGDTALTTELNLALALEADSRVEKVDFATVWGQGHTQAERTGTAEANFREWVHACLA